MSYNCLTTKNNWPYDSHTNPYWLIKSQFSLNQINYQKLNGTIDDLVNNLSID